MDREGFRNRLKQYKQAREENPGLKYWEFIRDNTDENGNIVSTKESPIYTEEYAKEQEQKRYAQKVVDEIKSKQRTFDQERTDTDRAGAIPYLSEKSITLTNAGKDTGVTLSTNVLDSIAKYAKNAELSLFSALGLAGQESTFGKGYNVEAKEILPSILVSNWNYGNPYGRADRSENPYLGLWNAANKKVNGYQGYYDSNQDFIYDQKFIDVLKGGLPYADKQAKRLRTDIPVLEHAFRKYKSGQYNPNDPNHTRMVEERGKALMKSPEIQKWLKTKQGYAEGGEVTDEGGWTESYWSRKNREAAHNALDPTMRFSPETLLVNNAATGEEDQYWRAYLGLTNNVPAMNKNAHTEWDAQIEAEKKKNGEPLSDFYGTTPNMDLSLQAVADTLSLGKISREYDKYSKTYNDLPSKKTIDALYNQAKIVMDNPGEWQQMYSDKYIIKNTTAEDDGETNPLGMLAHYGMKWVPEQNALYVHDTYDFPWYARWAGKIKERPKEMKIRSKIGFNPKKGSKLLHSAENYNNAYK